MLAALEADRARVAELQTRILAVERTLSELRLEQSKAHARLDSYKYPVLTLPNEIVSEIFMHFLPPYPAFPQLIGQFSPTLLTQICGKWRNIAVGTPELWSAISSFDNCHAWELRILELWLQRSRCCPLSIRLGTDTTWANGQSVDVVIPHRARLTYLGVNLKIGDLRIFEGPMPLLRHLDLLVAPGWLTDISLHEAPMLRTLSLTADAPHFTFPWTQLTSLNLPSTQLSILAQTRNLIHCELRVHYRDEDDAEPQRDIHLPCLESLTVIDFDHSPLPHLIPTLVTPALRSLEIPEDFLSPSPIDSLTAFLSKSGCRLEELRLTGERTLPERSYRQAFPLLHKLSFETADDTEDEDDS
ncbi:hypothetical protein DFH06DRAFT_1225441 [Mycena polygramma]|nr:hypothetical protein DFH06DRAFT_1225441 [Mycena polygramma]